MMERCVVGVQSLYAHLSSLQVSVGQAVHEGQTLDLSGKTGLAAGDHLHFTILVDGQFVNATEWWDPHWIQDRVLRKLREAGASQPAEVPLGPKCAPPQCGPGYPRASRCSSPAT